MESENKKLKTLPEIDGMLSNILAGTATDEEYLYFREWIRLRDHKEYFRQYKRLWNLTHELLITPEEKAAALLKYRRYIRSFIHLTFLRHSLKYAAIVLISFSAGYYLSVSKSISNEPIPRTATLSETSQQQTNAPVLIQADGTIVNLTATNANIQEKDGTILHRTGDRSLEYNKNTNADATPIYNTLQIPRGERFTLTLADGTRVWLNSETMLNYPVRFCGKNRMVRLTGQAYFEVKKDSLHPFIVKTDQLETEVLGTSFDVSSYPDSKESYIILVNGSVRANAYNQKIIMKPNEQLTVNSYQKKLNVSSVDAQALTEWKNGILRLADQSFEEMLHKLGRWYNVTFINHISTPITGRFNGKFDREDISEAIRTIAISAQIDYTQKNDTIIIYSKIN